MTHLISLLYASAEHFDIFFVVNRKIFLTAIFLFFFFVIFTCKSWKADDSDVCIATMLSVDCSFESCVLLWRIQRGCFFLTKGLQLAPSKHWLLAIIYIFYIHIIYFHIGKPKREHMYVLHRVCIWWNFLRYFMHFHCKHFVIFISNHTVQCIWIDCRIIFPIVLSASEGYLRQRKAANDGGASFFLFPPIASFTFITTITPPNTHRSVFILVFVFSRVGDGRSSWIRHGFWIFFQ